LQDLLFIESPAALVLALLAGFVIASLAMLPLAVLAVTTGAALGPAGVPAAVLFMALSSTAHFLLLRSTVGERLRRWFLGRFGHVRAVRAVDHVLSDLDWRMVALIRFAPSPGGLVTYLFGLSRIAVRPFVIGTALGPVLPLAFWAGVGAVGREALGSSLHGGRLLLMLVGLAALGLFLGVVGRRVRRALAGMGLDLAGDPS
jgi:uncharacterized membrane protein YdjX (TVP38/TMEM64 family)